MSGLTLLLVAAAFSGGTPRQLRRRILQVSARQVSARQRAASPGGSAQVLRLARRPSRGTERILRLLPRRATLMQRLEQTGRGISLLQYVGWTSAIVLAVSVSLVIFAGFGSFAALLSGVAIGLFLPHYIVGRMGRK